MNYFKYENLFLTFISKLTIKTTLATTTKTILYDAQACEHDALNIKCPSGQLIEINRATYGRSDRTYCCPLTASSSQCANTNCYSNITSIVSAKCDGFNRCSFSASIGTFNYDPCFNTIKYTNVNYNCIPNTTTTTTIITTSLKDDEQVNSQLSKLYIII